MKHHFPLLLNVVVITANIKTTTIFSNFRTYSLKHGENRPFKKSKFASLKESKRIILRGFISCRRLVNKL